ncbi:hypothetical protein [Mycolicibacter icosiumassiliensis]|uniref:hypothetical protein n=1 Tax=Mycolicibacter icosiumassiliensis TaxID=1792835 RepID=UPI000831A2A4|nr:hypothetical protein [Mycolicibacter icosiumassiliensis]
MYDEIIEKFESAAPPVATVRWIGDFFRITPNAVIHAIHAGRLPAEPITDADGKVLGYNVKPKDALLLWGHRLHKRGA